MNENEDVTALVKAIRRALKADHRIDVPHAALRASYLKAQGENPHAFRKKQVATLSATAPKALPTSPRHVEGMVTLQLHLACTDPMLGVYDCLSVDKDGEHRLPQDVDLQSAELYQLSAQVPRIREYGLPDYCQDPTGWFDALESPLRLAKDFNLDIEDLGDDSGDSAALLVRMPLQVRDALLQSVLGEPGTRAAVAEYVGQHHRRILERESVTDQGTWLLRFLGTEESLWGVTAEQSTASTEASTLTHVKELTFDALVQASVRNPRVRGAFEMEYLSDGRPAILYLDKGHKGRLTQDIWLEHNPTRNSVTYVVRLVDHDVGDALAQTETELTMAQAANLLDESVEQQLGLCALQDERARLERARWN